MKKTIVPIMVLVIALGGCSNKSEDLDPTPTQVPTPTATKTTNQPEPATDAPVEPTQDSDPRPDETTDTPVEPSISVSSSDAGTPATQFASRWGTAYPAVPKFAILKAANEVCDFMAENPNWDNFLTRSAVERMVMAFGIAKEDGVEFAQDARQNYCPSRLTP